MTRRRLWTILFIGHFYLSSCSVQSTNVEIPQGYVGWVEISIGDATCDDSTIRAVVRITRSGHGCTSYEMFDPVALTRFYYVAADEYRSRELFGKHWDNGGEIWAESVNSESNVYRFFVGSQEEYESTYSSPENSGSD